MYRVPRRAVQITFRRHGPQFSSQARLRAKDDESEFALLDSQPTFRSFSSSLDSPGRQAGAIETAWLTKSIKSSRILEKEDPSNDATHLIAAEMAPSKDAPGNRCRDRCAIVTGGTSGIGFEVAKKLILEGAGRVILCLRSVARGEQAVERMKRETGLSDAPLSIWDLQFSDKDRFIDLFRAFPLCNTLINCAGASQARLIYGITAPEVEAILDTNLSVPTLLTSRAMQVYFRRRKTLKKQGSQNSQDEKEPSAPESHDRADMMSYCIVNVASLLANKGGHGSSVYAATKAGLIALTRVSCLEAAELQKRSGGGPAFRVNTVVPGYVTTPMTEAIRGDHLTRIQNQIPLGRFATPEEVADAILFLVTNEYANNCVLNLDGGLSAT